MNLETAFKTKKRRSLQMSMLGRVLMCWVIPVILVVIFAGVYITNSTLSKTKQMIESSANNALSVMQTTLNETIESSLEASYKFVLRDNWRAYKLNENYIEFASKAYDYLVDQFKYDDKFLFTALVLKDRKDYRINVAENYPYTEMMFFWQDVSNEAFAMSENLGTNIGFIQKQGHLYLIRNLFDEMYYPYALLINEIDCKKLSQSLAGITWATDVTYWINDAEITLLGKNIAWDEQAENDGMLSYTGGGSPIKLTGEILNDRYTLRYAVYADAALIQSQVMNTQIILVAVIIFLVPLLVGVFTFMQKQISRPVNQLVNASQKIETGEFGITVNSEIMASQEMNYLGETFNAMSLTLKNQFEQIYSEELALRDAKIMALQSQINPHFLNNTLEIINWEARLAGDVKVCKMLEALSTMLNAAMDRKKRPTVHLSEELMYADSYLYIIRERLGKRLTITKEIPTEVLDFTVPRLMLQPVIENAVEHGISPRQKGNITIRAYLDKTILVLEIENDGAISEADQRRVEMILSGEIPLDKSTSLGIRNVNQRLKMIYGHNCGLTIKATENDTTLTRICINSIQDAQ